MALKSKYRDHLVLNNLVEIEILCVVLDKLNFRDHLVVLDNLGGVEIQICSEII